MSEPKNNTEAALQAMERGYQAVPIRDGGKAPFGQWRHLRWESEGQVRASFDRWREHDHASGIGLQLGEPSGGLVDIDLDHPKALRLKNYLLPPTAMRTGRVGNASSHFWYVVEDLEHLPATRRYVLPTIEDDADDSTPAEDADRRVTVELRSTGSQTVIPPSTWYPKKWKGTKDPRPTEVYRWEGEPWGGEEGPAKVDGRVLAVQVAVLHLATVLLEAWPKEGSRHDAYLALAGGLLRFGDGIHPFWEDNLPVVISALAEASHDDDGPDSRVTETMGTTLTRLRAGEKVKGFPALAEIIGNDYAEAARRAAKEVSSLAGYTPETIAQELPLSPRKVRQSELGYDPDGNAPLDDEDEDEDRLISTLPPEARNPMEERISSWSQVDLGPYLSGQIEVSTPEVLTREDGCGLFYPGRVNIIFGMSESAKTWIAMFAAVQEIGKGERVAYLDLEDEPAGVVARVRALGVGDDDIRSQFAYIHPESPIAPMQRGKYGPQESEDGKAADSIFRAFLDAYDPTTIVVDGMTMLYGLHGQDTNDATSTDVITTWLKSLCRSGRSTVIVIDHTGKGGGAGSSPIGAHHKIAMVQGAALRADAVTRPIEGQVGRIKLVVYKDRLSAVRKVSFLPPNGSEQIAGMVVMDSTEPGKVKMRIEPPNPREMHVGGEKVEGALESLNRSQEIQDRIFDEFGGELNRPLTTREIVEKHHYDKKDVLAAWDLLLAEGVVRREGSNRWTKFYLVEPRDEGEL